MHDVKIAFIYFFCLALSAVCGCGGGIYTVYGVHAESVFGPFHISFSLFSLRFSTI